MKMQSISLILALSASSLYPAENYGGPIEPVQDLTQNIPLSNKTLLSFEFNSGCFRIQDDGLDEEIYTFSYPIVAYADALDEQLLAFGLENGTVHMIHCWRNEGGKTMIDNHAILHSRRSLTRANSGIPAYAIEFLEGNNSLRIRYALQGTDDMDGVTETATVVYRLPTFQIISEAFCISPPMHRPSWLEMPQ